MKTIECDCSCADTCPQGRVGSRQRCRILKDESVEARSTLTPATVNERLDEAFRRINAQAEVIAGMAAKIEALTTELTSHRVNTADGLGQNDERIDNIEKHSEAMQTTIDELTRQNVHQAIINLEGIQRDDEQAKHIGTLQEAQRLTISRLDYHAHYFGLPKFASLGPEAKPTIKGGWANVYKFGSMNLHPTREAADQAAIGNSRIACIQIRDIAAGEGLTPRSDALKELGL